MCELTVEEKLKSNPVMVRGDALRFYETHMKRSSSYDEAMDLLRKWYNSVDKKARILSKWEGMSLTKAMTDEPEESEVEIFRKFVARMIDTRYGGITFREAVSRRHEYIHLLANVSGNPKHSP